MEEQFHKHLIQLYYNNCLTINDHTDLTKMNSLIFSNESIVVISALRVSPMFWLNFINHLMSEISDCKAEIKSIKKTGVSTYEIETQLTIRIDEIENEPMCVLLRDKLKFKNDRISEINHSNALKNKRLCLLVNKIMSC